MSKMALAPEKSLHQAAVPVEREGRRARLPIFTVQEGERKDSVLLSLPPRARAKDAPLFGSNGQCAAKVVSFPAGHLFEEKRVQNSLCSQKMAQKKKKMRADRISPNFPPLSLDPPAESDSEAGPRCLGERATG